MEVGLIVGLTVVVLAVFAALIGLRARRRSERVVGVEDAGPIVRAGGSAPAPAPVIAAADMPAAPAGDKAPLGAIDLDELLESRFMRRAVARAYETGQHEEAVKVVVRLGGVSEADARAFIEKVRQRGPDDA